MIGVSLKPSRSSSSRIARTRPSIMSLGATMSAPASTWLAAVRASSFSVGSFRILAPALSRRTMPQWPCSMYSHRHTSVMTSSCGQFLLQQAHGLLDDAVGGIGARSFGVFAVGNAEQQHGRHARLRCARAASRSSSSGESWNTPGMAWMGRRSLRPLRTNNGRTNCADVQLRFADQPAQGRATGATAAADKRETVRQNADSCGYSTFQVPGSKCQVGGRGSQAETVTGAPVSDPVLFKATQQERI